MRLDPEELLAELGWLRRLARSLVGPVGAEEDLVQETWLAANRVEGGVSRAWLVGTLRNLAARWHRRESRLRRREDAAAQPEAVDTNALVERNELFGEVLGELRNLEEPFRTALFLLYQEGLSIQEAAARLDVPADTLRWRRREGLQRLRKRLDVGDETGRDWRGAFMPLLGLPSMDPTAAAASSSAAAGTLTHVGGILMSFKLIPVALAVGIALFVVYQSQGTDEALQGSAVPESLVMGETSGAIESSTLPVVDQGSREAQEPAAIREVTQTTAPVWDGPTLAVQVVDGSRRAVQDARIWIGETPDPIDDAWRTDAEGIAQIPMPEEVCFISGATKALYGKTAIIPQLTGGEMMLQIRPDADLSVQVVDGDGAPVPGLPVAIITRHLERGNLGFHNTVTTDARGEALMRHVLEPFVLAGTSFEISVGPAILLGERADVVLHRERIPKETLRITLPPTTSVRAQVFDAKGAANHSAQEIRIAIDPAPGTERELEELVRLVGSSPLGVLEFELVDGAVAIPFVGLGLDLIARSKGADPTDTTFGLGRSPQDAGLRGELALHPLEVGTSISGVARAADGSLLANRSLSGLVLLSGRVWIHNFSADVITDAQGRFSVHAEDEMLRLWSGALRRRLMLFADDASPLDLLQSDAALPERLRPGSNDLGEVRFAAATPLVSGHAVDINDRAVLLEYVDTMVVSSSDATHIRPLFDTHTVIRGDAFAVFTSPKELVLDLNEALRVMANAADFPPTRVEALPGATDVVLAFREAGELSGTVLTDPGHSPTSYTAHFYETMPSGQRVWHGAAQLAVNGRFTLTGLPLESGDLEIQEASTATSVATIRGVTPTNGAGVQDARLARIDLRFSLHEFQLQVVDEQGAGIADVLFESDALDMVLGSFRAGSFRLRAAEDVLEGTLRAAGFRSATVRLVPGEQTATLQAGPQVIVKPDSPLDLPRGARIELLLVAVDHREELSFVALAGGGYSTHVSRPGEYELRGRVLRRGVLLAELPLSADPAARLVVTEQALGQEFEVSVDRSAFEDSVPEE